MIPLRDSIRPKHFPLINIMLVATNLIIFFKEATLPQDQLAKVFYSLGIIPAKVSIFIEKGIPFDQTMFSFLTAMFLHGSWFHVIGNMLYLWVFGDNIEDRLGHIKYLFFYLIAGMVASIVQVAINPYSKIPIVGASGAVAGVLGAYIVNFPHSRILALVPLLFFITLTEIPAVIFIFFWFILQIFNGVASLGASVNAIAWWAHIGGFISGVILGKILAKV